MLKINKLTDYASLILGRLAAKYPEFISAQDIAEMTTLPYPTVSKILKMLSRENILTSNKGINGGYQFSRPPEMITLADLIKAMEGQKALTECGVSLGTCQFEKACTARHKWNKVDQLIFETLDKISIAEFSEPANESFVIQPLNKTLKQ